MIRLAASENHCLNPPENGSQEAACWDVEPDGKMCIMCSGGLLGTDAVIKALTHCPGWVHQSLANHDDMSQPANGLFSPGVRLKVRTALTDGKV